MRCLSSDGAILVALAAKPDWCIGHSKAWISNTFLFRKADPA